MTRTSRNVPARRVDRPASDLATRLGAAVLDVVGRIPDSDERTARAPDAQARRITNAARNKAALSAGTLALPPGLAGWLTVVPELLVIWRIQAQMVADIAGAYGKTPDLGRQQMLYCLFRHAAAQAVRDVAVQVGGRLLIQDVPLRTLERAATMIGIHTSRRLLGNGLARWLPVIGAVGVGSYAYYDTSQVARTAQILFAAPAAAAATPMADSGAASSA